MLVVGYHEGKLSVYNYRNSTYDSCKRKARPDMEGCFGLQLSQVTFSLIKFK